MMKTCALIGFGQWGKNLAKTLYEMGVLHTICETNYEVIQSQHAFYPDVFFTDDFHQVLKNPSIKHIFIATPASLHFEMGQLALDAQKDVFIEKPLCFNSCEAKKLCALAKEKKSILMVGHLYHYHPAFIALKELIQRGELGELKYIAAHRLKHGTIRTEENVLWSFSPHDLSMILSLSKNQMPEKILCDGTSMVTDGVHDLVTAHFIFPSGLKAHLYASWVHPYKEQKLIVVGSQGMAVLDDTKPMQEKLFVTQGIVSFKENKPFAHTENKFFYPLLDMEPLREECKYFLMCCHQRIEPISNGEEGVRVLELLEKCQKKLQTDQNRKFYAHESAIIEEGAIIGAGTRIWHYSNIKTGCQIGSNCNLGQNVVIFPNAVIGNGCKIQNNVSVYSGVICEDDVFLGPSMVFTNVKNPRSHVCRRGMYQTTILRKGVSIGANATILCGIELGEYTFVGAGAVVTKNTIPFSIMAGNPAKQIGWMSKYGEKLNLPLFTEQELIVECPESKEKYRLKGQNLTVYVEDKIEVHV